MDHAAGQPEQVLINKREYNCNIRATEGDMINSIIECIANYSEARRPEVVDSIAKAIEDVPGVFLLDRHSDLDHNRTVLTFAGAPVAVEEAAFRSIAIAAELINLDVHTGEHPRIGATDVVPFVPIRGVNMQECVEIARRLGKRVGEELGIPVYLYEEAATRPDRQNLENIRRGQYEGLKGEIATNPERLPDFGPQRLGGAGATVIGARHPLIAFNVYLTTEEVSIAKKIAKALRYSSGGLRYVKALGMLVDGRAQVSMNLTNYKDTPVERVVELIRREAGRYGVGIHHSELVGLIPEDALMNAAVWYLQLDHFETDQILERRLASALTGSGAGSASASEDFLSALASESPAPGGGSAAAYSGSAAAALVAMVARLTIGRKKYAKVDRQMQSVLERAEVLRGNLTAAVTEDASAFEAVMAAFKLPKDTPEEEHARLEAIQSTILNAARVPLQVARQLVEVLKLVEQVVESGNLNAITDGGTGGELARAAFNGASMNIRINLAGLQDKDSVDLILTELKKLQDEADGSIQRIRTIVSERGGLAAV
jgi:glutamate formiminotransferase/formiminotetrahydrofolate cyclodeaminase